MCANSSSEDEPYVTPKFVFDKGAKYRIGGAKGNQYIPEWKDEIFLKYVDEFTKALGERYNGNPNIAFIDIRTYGNFGEQHLFGLDALDENGEIDKNYTWENKIEPEFLREKYIKPYMQAFPDTLLIIPWGEDDFNNVYEELIDEGVSLRRDGIITYDNGLETCAKTYGKLPMVFEYASKYEKYTKTEFNTKLEEAISLAKPSYIELDKEWYKDGNQDYCKELANRIGYYFRLKKASYPKNIKINTPSNMSFEFKNDGTTPICEDCSVYVGLLDQNNKLVKKYKTDINPRNWLPGTLSTEEVSVTFDNINSGNYKLAVGLYKNDEDVNPTYLLGSEGKTEEKWYVCGDVNVEGNKAEDISNYTEKVMKNPPTITKVEDEKSLENTTVWCTPKSDDKTVNPIYKSYNSILEPVSWRNSIIGQNSIYSSKNEWPQLYSIEFVVNCKEFFVNTCTSFRILVDEGNGYEITNREGIEQTTDETGTSSDSFKGVWHKITFNEKKERKIRVELTDCVFNGVRLYKDDEIKAITRPSNQKVLYVGSSITRGADLPAYYSWPNVVSNILNLECMNNGVGGTGYLADTKGKNDAYYDRLVILIEKLKPDVIVLEAGPNDFWSDYKANQVIPEAERCIDYIKNNTDAKLITIGVYYPNVNVPSDAVEINDKLRQQALQKKVPFIDLLTGDTYNEKGEKITIGTESYITGTGHIGKIKNDGNADKYVLEDGVHLSAEGNKYFGEKLSVEIGKLLETKPEPQEPINDTDIVSLYCWDIDDFNLSKLKDEVEYLNVNTLYVQRPSNATQNDRLKQIMEFAKQYKLDVFLLDGARDWLTEGDMNNAISVVDQAYEINKTLDYKLKGVSLDVEFYLTDDYQAGDTDRQIELFKKFTENTKKCCDYANNLGLGYSMALPVWLNKLSQEELENLMNYNYDHIAFMNYYKETIMENIDEEVEIAKKHNIKIVSIAEVQDPRKGTVGEEDTFYDEGLQTCINTLNDIRQKYNYENLGISYHYYKPLLDLLERDTDVGIENRYEVEVSPYIDGKSIKVDEAIITGDGKTLQPIYGYYNESQKYVLNFYGLEYGKEYTLTVKSGNFTGTKTFIYQKGDENLNELEIAHMDILLEENKPSEEQPGETNPGEENKPSEEQPGETNPGEENKPSEEQPEETNPGEENKPNNEQLEENKSSQKKQEDAKQEKSEVNKYIAMAPSVLPKAGKNDFIIKLLIISIIAMFSLLLLNRCIRKK